MTKIFDDPAKFHEDATAGFVDLYSQYVRAVPGGVVRRNRPPEPKVAVVTGGGSGHYPAFCGSVGPGFADGAVIGAVFTSPSTAQAYSVGKHANSGKGVIFAYGNYAGDVLNFTQAGDRLEAEGIPVRQMIVTDDVASAPKEEAEKRRGIAGDVTVFKVIAAAAERGDDIDKVMELGEHANDNTFSIGVAFSGCTFPGADEPLFTVPEGKMGFGLGIHGEPGLKDIDILPSPELAKLLVDTLLEEKPEGASGRVAIILNGLGATKYEELYGLYGHVSKLIRDAGLEIVGPECGELVPSLDMGGVSLTFMWLDDELEELWLAPCDSPSLKRGVVDESLTEGEELPDEADAVAVEEEVEGDEDSVKASAIAIKAFEAMKKAIHDNESEFAKLDTFAGDGDHGAGMVRGVDAARDAAEKAKGEGWGLGGTLTHAADAWAEHAGGTSGALWGAGIRYFGEALGNSGKPDGSLLSKAADAFADGIVKLGKAEPGDKTMVDSILPFTKEFAARIADGDGIGDAWKAAVDVALKAADDTAELSPKKGRARPLAERSIGHADPGATSFAKIVEALAPVFEKFGK